MSERGLQGLTAVLLVVILSNLTSLWYPFGEDHALSHLMGKLILEGGIPYREALDVKPPAIFYLHALLNLLGGDGMHCVRLADLACLTVTIGLMWLVGKRLRGPYAPLWGGLLFGLAYSAIGFWNMGLQESFLLPFLWWSLLCAIKGWAEGDLRQQALCGVCLGVVFWFKYPYALPLAVLVLGQVCRAGLSRHPWKASLRAVVVLMGGFFVVLGAVALYLSSIGALGELFRITGLHNVVLRVHHPLKESTGLLSSFRWVALKPLTWAMFAVAAAGMVFLMKSKPRGGWIVLAYTLCMLVVVCLQLRFYRYHWIPLLSCLCFSAGYAMEGLRNSLNRLSFFRRAGMRTYMMASLAALVIVGTLAYHRESIRRCCLLVTGKLSLEAYFATFSDPKMNDEPFVFQDWQVSRALQGMHLPEQTLFIWGFRPLVFYFSGFRASTPFLVHSPLLGSGIRGERWQRRLQKDFLNHPPGAVIIKLSGDWQATLKHLAYLVPEMHALLTSQYMLDGKIGPFLVYERLGAM